MQCQSVIASSVPPWHRVRPSQLAWLLHVPPIAAPSCTRTALRPDRRSRRCGVHDLRGDPAWMRSVTYCSARDYAGFSWTLCRPTVALRVVSTRSRIGRARRCTRSWPITRWIGGVGAGRVGVRARCWGCPAVTAGCAVQRICGCDYLRSCWNLSLPARSGSSRIPPLRLAGPWRRRSVSGAPSMRWPQLSLRSP